MHWRGLFGLFNVKHRGNIYGMVVNGLEWSASTTNFTEIRLWTPQMNNMITIPSTLAVSNSEWYCPIDIERGDNPYLGIDLALLGLVKETVKNQGGTVTSPYGMSSQIEAIPEYYDSRWTIRPDDMGLFGLCPSYGESGYTVCRISKWLD